jgi:hypothetical protein
LLGLTGLANWAMVRHVIHGDLAHEERRDLTQTVSLVLAAVFFLSAAAAFLSTLLAYALWVATILLRYPLRRLSD